MLCAKASDEGMRLNVQAFSLFFALLAICAQLFVAGAIVLLAVARFSPSVKDRARRIREYLAPAALSLAWVVAVVAVSGSLFYSEVAGYVPCTLCWYQRIAMYPLALVLGIAALKNDLSVRRYVVPLATAGALISIYHYQLQRFPGQSSFSCTASSPCSLTYVWKFHYISIPLMALSAFAIIITLVLIAGRTGEPDEDPSSESRELLEVGS